MLLPGCSCMSVPTTALRPGGASRETSGPIHNQSGDKYNGYWRTNNVRTEMLLPKEEDQETKEGKRGFNEKLLILNRLE